MDIIKILIVDDHKMIKEGLHLMLKGEPEIKVVSDANNGEEAIAYLLEKPNTIDVVLMDINMPNMDGIKTTQYIHDHIENVKVLALSMHTEENYITGMIKAGAMGYLLKESDTKELIKAIKTVSSGSKYYSNKVSVIMINAMMSNKTSGGGLSSKEKEVLTYIASGTTNKEISFMMQMSGKSVETHRKSILGKLDLKNSADLIRYAYNNNLLN